MTEMLAVMAVAAAEDRALVLGSIQAGLVENRADLVIVVVAEGGDIGADAALRDRARDFIHLEQFGNERSEEHTSELQSLMRISYAVFCLKKQKHTQEVIRYTQR